MNRSHGKLWPLLLLMYAWSGTTLASTSANCEFKPWTDHKQTRIHVHPNRSAYAFITSHMRVDADGAPNAYHPENRGLDYLANAGYPNSTWWLSVLVPDPVDARRAYVQTTGQYAGYFVSKTSLQDKSKSITDPSRYVDAGRIPYLVFPGSFLRMKGTGLLGDIGIAVNLDNGTTSSFVVADIGPSNARLGEVSIALAERLGGKNVNPKNGSGTPDGRILYVLFPYSSRVTAWPQSVDAVAQRANELLRQAGGMEALVACKDVH